MNIKVLVASAVAAFSSLPVIAQQAPAPCGLVPSARQLEWYNREMIEEFHDTIDILWQTIIDKGIVPELNTRRFDWIAGSGCRH